MPARFRIPDFPRDRPTVPEVRERVAEYYCQPGNGVGGSLHVLVDDRNLERHTVEWTRTFALERGDAEGAEIAGLMLQMTPTQRRKVANTHEGYERQRARAPQRPILFDHAGRLI